MLANSDLPEVIELLAQRPVQNLFVRARIASGGMTPGGLGCAIWGHETDGELTALCHAGSNLVPVNADAAAIRAFAEFAGPRRRAASLMGESDQVLLLWESLVARWGAPWASPRDVRQHQPLMVLDGPPQVDVDESVQQITMADFDIYFDAAVKMYTEEVGVSPLDSSGGYTAYVRKLIREGRAFGSIDSGRVIFKSDVGSAAGDICQIQGVWLDPAKRGTGRSIPAMARVAQLCRMQWPSVSLYVNDYNTPARRLYERIGFETIGEFATILF